MSPDLAKPSSTQAPATTAAPRVASRRWRTTFRVLLFSAPRPLMAVFAQRVRRMPYAELEIVGRNTGQERRTVLTLFVVDGLWYVGHPNGESQWVRNLIAANSAVLIKGHKRTGVRPFELLDGEERDKVVNATSHQPFPAGLFYRAGRAHVRSVGSYFRLVPEDFSAGLG